MLLRPYTIADGRWRLPVTLADVDPMFITMLEGYEDRRFAEHHGVDWRALLRAAGQMVRARPYRLRRFDADDAGGAADRGQARRAAAEGKLRQIVLAPARSRTASTSRQILSLYLALAPYGGNLEGIRAATLAYFGKEPRRLTVAEAALLVACRSRRRQRRPDRDPKAAKAARDRVLDRLVDAGVIDAETAASAKTERIPDGAEAFPMLAAHLGDAARKPIRRSGDPR